MSPLHNSSFLRYRVRPITVLVNQVHNYLTCLEIIITYDIYGHYQQSSGYLVRLKL